MPSFGNPTDTTGRVRDLAISSLVAAESRYACLRGGEPGREQVSGMARSLGELGQLSPVLVHEAAAGELELMDGFVRARAAAELGWTTLSCAVLERQTPVESALGLVVTVRREALSASAVAAARLVAMAARAGVARARLRDWLLPALGLEAHERVLDRCLAVADLPAPVADFCAEKGLALGQCAQLARHSRELLEEVFSWRDRISLTASLAEELVEDLGDYLCAHPMSPAELAGREEIRAVLDAGDSPQRAARRLRDRVRSLRAPLLTGANRRMDAIAASLGLPERVRITWDRSLERRELGLHIALGDPHEWPETLARLQRAEVERGVAALLEEL